MPLSHYFVSACVCPCVCVCLVFQVLTNLWFSKRTCKRDKRRKLSDPLFPSTYIRMDLPLLPSLFILQKSPVPLVSDFLSPSREASRQTDKTNKMFTLCGLTKLLSTSKKLLKSKQKLFCTQNQLFSLVLIFPYCSHIVQNSLY